MVFISRRLILAAVLVAPSCQQAGTSRVPQVRFEVRGLQNQAVNNEYGSISYTHKATIVALGDSALTSRPYLVLLHVNKLSGGDPGQAARFPMTVAETVVQGVGDFTLYGGYHLKTETWEPEKIEISVVGFVPAFPLAGSTTRTP